MMVKYILLLLISVTSFASHAETVNNIPQTELRCLTNAVYFEAVRSDIQMQRAVASVIINRVEDPRYPNTICGVVHQQVKNTCQFSWYCEPKRKINETVWDSIKTVTQQTISEWLSNENYDITNGATHYHDQRVRPTWSHRLKRTYVVDTLTFYK